MSTDLTCILVYFGYKFIATFNHSTRFVRGYINRSINKHGTQQMMQHLIKGFNYNYSRTPFEQTNEKELSSAKILTKLYR